MRCARQIKPNRSNFGSNTGPESAICSTTKSFSPGFRIIHSSDYYRTDHCLALVTHSLNSVVETWLMWPWRLKMLVIGLALNKVKDSIPWICCAFDIWQCFSQRFAPHLVSVGPRLCFWLMGTLHEIITVILFITVILILAILSILILFSSSSSINHHPHHSREAG